MTSPSTDSSQLPLRVGAEHMDPWVVKKTVFTLWQLSRNFYDCGEKLTA